MRNKKIILSVIAALSFCGGFFNFGVCLSENRISADEPTVSVFENSEEQLIPIGKSVGVTLNIDGVMVVGTCEILGENNKYSSPSQNAGIKNGDIIKSLNNTKIETVSAMSDILNNSAGQTINCIIERDNNEISTQVTPIKALGDNGYKIGAWVKDAASGIGTITYYNPQNNTFGALGHGITDSSTGDVIDAKEGNITKVNIAAIKRGEKGQPGEITGVFSESTDIFGNINENNRYGLFGSITDTSILKSCGESIPVLHKKDVKTGKAQILCNIEGNKTEAFDIEIQKLLTGNADSSKGLVIKVCDERLIQKTGGIVQGMSGSPIIQDNALVGAVTHVFVNDPTRGYGIFAEVMLDNSA